MSTHPAHQHTTLPRPRHASTWSHMDSGPAAATAPPAFQPPQVASFPPLVHPQPQAPVMAPVHKTTSWPASFDSSTSTRPRRNSNQAVPAFPPTHYHSPTQSQRRGSLPLHKTTSTPISYRPPAAYQAAYRPPPGYVPSKVLPPPELPKPVGTQAAPARSKQQKQKRRKSQDKKEEEGQKYDDFIELGLEFVGKLARSL